jgi:queuosine precursor transporter
MIKQIQVAFLYLKEYLIKEKNSRAVQYEIISHIENHTGDGETYVKVRKKYSRKTFIKPVHLLYDKKWLDAFSGEDAAFIGILYFSDKSGEKQIVTNFPRKKQAITKNVIFIGMLFVSFLILSNLTAFKVSEVHLSGIPLLNHLISGNIIFPAALIFFPLTYFFDDTLTEVYGFRTSRYIIWGGLLCNTLVTLGVMLTVRLPASPEWHFQDSYALVYNSALRVFIASSVGYFFGEFVNSMILSKLKIATAGRWLWLRVVLSTSIGVLIDSIVFCNLAFYGVMPISVIWTMVLVQYIFKVSYEILILPVTYIITGYLKKKDHVDYYDYETNYNPFSLSMDED